MSTMTKNLVSGLRRFHADERGDVMQNMCVAGVGGLITLILGKYLKQLAGVLGNSIARLICGGQAPGQASLTDDTSFFGAAK